MRWSIERKISTGFAIALLVLSLIGCLAFWSTTQLISTAHWVEHTHVVIADLEALFAHLSSAEAGQRGYIITGNEQHLEPYYLATNSIHEMVNEIRQLTSDNAAQQQRLQALEPALERRLLLLKEALNARRQSGFAAAQALIEQDVGRQLTREISQGIHAMLEEERRLLTLRSEQSQFAAWNTMAVVGIGGFLAVGLVPVAGLTEILHHSQ